MHWAGIDIDDIQIDFVTPPNTIAWDGIDLEDIQVPSPSTNIAWGSIDLKDVWANIHSPMLPASWDKVDLDDIHLDVCPALDDSDLEMNLEEVSLAFHFL